MRSRGRLIAMAMPNVNVLCGGLNVKIYVLSPWQNYWNIVNYTFILNGFHRKDRNYSNDSIILFKFAAILTPSNFTFFEGCKFQYVGHNRGRSTKKRGAIAV